MIKIPREDNQKADVLSKLSSLDEGIVLGSRINIL